MVIVIGIYQESRAEEIDILISRLFGYTISTLDYYKLISIFFSFLSSNHIIQRKTIVIIY